MTDSTFEADAVRLARLVENAPVSNPLVGLARTFLSTHGYPTIKEMDYESQSASGRAWAKITKALAR